MLKPTINSLYDGKTCENLSNFNQGIVSRYDDKTACKFTKIVVDFDSTVYLGWGSLDKLLNKIKEKISFRIKTVKWFEYYFVLTL